MIDKIVIMNGICVGVEIRRWWAWHEDAWDEMMMMMSVDRSGGEIKRRNCSEERHKVV